MGSATSRRDPDEKSDLRKLIDEVIDEPEQWLNAPNDQLGGEKPVDLLGSDRESLLRQLVRAIKIGMPV
jgi:Protein of unknown function (DUF2384)